MAPRKNGLPKYCGWNKDRHGKMRVRFRRGGFSTYLCGPPFSERFMKAYHAALAGVALPDGAGAEKTKPGTFNELAVLYYKSIEFQNLKASTQRMRRNIIERFRAKNGTKLVVGINRAVVKQIMADRAATPTSANNLLKILSLMLDCAVEHDLIQHNPAKGVKKFKIVGDGHRPWSDAELAQFEAKHALGTRARLAYALFLYTGQRLSDVVTMSRQHVRDGVIEVKQEKTGAELIIPIHPKLREAMDACKGGNGAFVTTGRREAFSSAASFGNWFADCIGEAGLPDGCVTHGLRKVASEKLAEVGCTVSQIMSITGHASLSEVQRYTKKADQARLARQAMAKWGAEGEQGLSNLDSGLDKIASK